MNDLELVNVKHDCKDVSGAFRPANMTNKQYGNFYASTRLHSNNQVGFYYFDLVYLRLHNFIVRFLHKKYAHIDSSRNFEITQNIVAALSWYIAVNEYIKIGYFGLPDEVNVAFFPKTPLDILKYCKNRNYNGDNYNRTNHSTELNVLNYRFHNQCPEIFMMGENVSISQTNIVNYQCPQKLHSFPPNEVLKKHGQRSESWNRVLTTMKKS